MFKRESLQHELRDPLAGDGLTEAFEQTFQVRHSLPEHAHMFTQGVDTLALRAHFIAQTSERRTDRDQDRNRSPYDCPSGSVHVEMILP